MKMNEPHKHGAKIAKLLPYYIALIFVLALVGTQLEDYLASNTPEIENCIKNSNDPMMIELRQMNDTVAMRELCRGNIVQ